MKQSIAKSLKVMRLPKAGDILVLAKNRNIIYSYNPNGNSFNSFDVAVYLTNKEAFVTYKQDNNSVVAYDAPFDFATKEERELFKSVVRDYELSIEPDDDDYDNILDVANEFCSYMSEVTDVDDTLEEAMMDDIVEDLLNLREDLIKKYAV